MKELIERLRDPHSCKSWSDADKLHEVAAAALERLTAEVNRQKSCILTMAEEIQTLVREKADMQEKIRTYHQHGVTCQTFGHVVGACSECNTHIEQDVNETNHVLASNYLKMLPEFERLTFERDQLLQSAERVRVYKQRCLEAISERDAALAASRHETDMCQQALDTVKEVQVEVDRTIAERDALRAGLAAALDFAGTVAGGSSWWEDVWKEHDAAIAGEKK